MYSDSEQDSNIEIDKHVHSKMFRMRIRKIFEKKNIFFTILRKTHHSNHAKNVPNAIINKITNPLVLRLVLF